MEKGIGRDTHIFLCIVTVMMASIIVNIIIKSGYELDGFFIGRDNYEIIISSGLSELVIMTVFIRLRQLILIYILYRILNPEAAYSVIIALFAFVAGSMLSIQTFYGGAAGVLEFLAFTFPHYIFYFLIIKMIYYYIKRGYKVNIRILITISILFVSGLIGEIFFSKIFLNQIFQYIVPA